MIDSSLNIPILHQSLINSEDELDPVVKQVKRLVKTNDDCWGRLTSKKDTWSSYPLNKDALFNYKAFDEVSYKLKDVIMQYMMNVRADTITHQVNLMDSTVYLSQSNPYSDFSKDTSQHFKGMFFVSSEGSIGNLIFKNPISFPMRFYHTGDSPLKEYHNVSCNTGDVVIFPSIMEYKMSNFVDKELIYIEFNITVT